jgi:hypothetical protein
MIVSVRLFQPPRCRVFCPFVRFAVVFGHQARSAVRGQCVPPAIMNQVFTSMLLATSPRRSAVQDAADIIEKEAHHGRAHG